MAIDYKKLMEPFDENDVEWFIGVTNKDKTKGLAIPFITNRAVQDRLDEACGPENWYNEYRPLKDSDIFGKDGTILGRKSSQLCGISVWSEARNCFVTKWDGAEESDIEAVKGSLSSAMKRAATQWGIGRYLYKLDNVWVEIEQKGNTYVMKPTQKIVMPPWALPGGTGMPGANDCRRPTVQFVGQDYSYQQPQQQEAPQQQAPQQPPQQQRSGNLSQKQVDRAIKKGMAANQTVDDIHLWILRKFGISSIADLNRAQYDELCAALDQAAMQRQ